MSDNLHNISKLTEKCYDNLEKTGALINLLKQKFLGDKTVDVTLDIITSNIKGTTENILEIQNALSNRSS